MPCSSWNRLTLGGDGKEVIQGRKGSYLHTAAGLQTAGSFRTQLCVNHERLFFADLLHFSDNPTHYDSPPSLCSRACGHSPALAISRCLRKSDPPPLARHRSSNDRDQTMTWLSQMALPLHWFKGYVELKIPRDGVGLNILQGSMTDRNTAM